MDLEETDDNFNKDDDSNSDSGSSDEFDEDSEVAVADVAGKVTASDQYKAAMQEEDSEVATVVDSVNVKEIDFDKISTFVNFLERFYCGKSSYIDISSMFVDGAPFIVDATALITHVMRDSNYDGSFGGQSLHFVYLCERIIQLLCRKGGSCEVFFFNEKSVVWREVPHYSLIENILRVHLKKNTNITVHIVESIFDKHFDEYIHKIRPCFMLFDFLYYENIEHLFQSSEKAELAEMLFKTYILYTLTLGMYCVNITDVELRDNKLYTFIVRSDPQIVSTKDKLQNFGNFISKKCGNNFAFTKNMPNVDTKDLTKTTDIRSAVLVYVAKMLVEDDSLADNENISKAFLIYSALISVLPLETRCFENSSRDSVYMANLLNRVIKFIDHCLKSKKFDDCNCGLIADIWQGNLFVEVFYALKEIEKCSSLGKTVDQVYGEFVTKLNKLANRNFKSYPISLNHLPDENKVEPIGKNGSTKQDFNKTLACSKFLSFPIQNDIVSGFCSDIIRPSNTSYTEEEVEKIVMKNNAYFRKYSWDNRSTLSNAYDRIKEGNKYDPNLSKKKVDRLKAKHAHYMDIYGSNLEGKTIERKPIVCEPESKKKPKAQKKEKPGKNALKIVEDNNLMKHKKLLEEESARFIDFRKNFKSNSNAGKSYQINLSLIQQSLLNIKTDLYTGKILVRKADTLFSLWEETCRKSKDKHNRDLLYLKELFLTIREILNISKTEPTVLADKESQKLGKRLCQIGFKQIAEKWSLPLGDDPTSNSMVTANESCVRFQMIHLGPELERKVEGEPDFRATGFIPDKWQRELFDVVDKRQSALIVAPTSSGKTYASYYCMEKVLRESNDGRVVYVAPTKALVNQVAATIHSRFKGKNMLTGMSLYGVFTMDYRINALESQILVTVPECLELLLMSPSTFWWTKKLRYAIFDEVHCLAGNAGQAPQAGVCWERCLMMIPCPFLALSATIQSPRDFHTWMQKAENFKKESDKSTGTKVYLVTYSERHNDLVKHIYGNDKTIHHIHPYAYLNDHVIHTHEGIPKNISLAPGEMVQLYDTMDVIDKNDEDLKLLNPDEYFKNSSTGFIFRHEAKAYEAELRKVIEKWYKDKTILFRKVIESFREPLLKHETSTKNLGYFMSNIHDLVEMLRNKNMLPALVFSYERQFCEILAEILTVFYEKLEASSDKKKKPVKQEAQEEYYSDRDDDKPVRKNKIKLSSGKREEHRRRNPNVDFFPLGLTDCDFQFSIRVMAGISMKDLQFIENRLVKKFFKRNDPAIAMLRRGIGYHHPGAPTIIRNTVEMLFRMKFLNVVFATGTLALGVHMPCKTVVVLGDSPHLNTLEYQQISGRAGRRGFDKTGDVIFFGIDVKKMQTLQTSKLPKIHGNFPLSVTTVYRFMCLFKKLSDKDKDVEDKERRIVLNRILTVLNESFLYHTHPDLKIQLKYFFFFSCQLLVKLGMLSSTGNPHVSSSLLGHLHSHEPGSLAFLYLLRTGVLAKVCKPPQGKTYSLEACQNIVLLLSRLFTRIPYRKRKQAKKFQNSLVELPPLPPVINKALESYNEEVKTVFICYLKGCAKNTANKYGKDEKLPVSGQMFKGKCTLNELDVKGDKPLLDSIVVRKSKQNSIASAFAGLSGQTDNTVFNQDGVVGNVRHEIFTDYKCIPVLDLETTLNGYAYDFYCHGSLKSILKENGLRAGQDYNLLHEFLFILKNINLSLNELAMFDNSSDKDLNTCVRETFSVVYNTYFSAFIRAYDGARDMK